MKKPELSDVFKKHDKQPQSQDANISANLKKSATLQEKKPIPPSRQGKKALTVYFDPDVIKQLKIMAASKDTTIQSLLSEALNDFFKKYGKPYIV